VRDFLNKGTPIEEFSCSQRQERHVSRGEKEKRRGGNKKEKRKQREFKHTKKVNAKKNYVYSLPAGRKKKEP